MSHVVANLVEQTSTSRGATTLVLSGPPRAPYRAFNEVMSDGDTTEVMVVNNDRREEWQAAVYRYTSGGVLTLMRFYDSPTGSPMSFGSGLKRIFISPIVSRGDWRIVSADFQALHLDRLHVVGDVEITLPLNPSNGEVVEMNDKEGAWQGAPPTVLGNGKSIEFFGATDTDVQLGGGPVAFTFDEAADVWRVS